MSALTLWWRGLASRERLVLMLGGAALLAVLYGVLGIFGIILAIGALIAWRYRNRRGRALPGRR